MPCSWQVQGVWLGLHVVTVGCNTLPVPVLWQCLSFATECFVRMLMHCLCEYL